MNQILTVAPRQARLLTQLLLLAAVAAATGCWEEIHYNPSPQTAPLGNQAEVPIQPQSMAQDEQKPVIPPVPPAESPASATAEAEPALIERQPEPAGIAATETPPLAVEDDDLFGGQTLTPPAMDESPAAVAEPDATAALTAEDPILPTPPETSGRMPELGPLDADSPTEFAPTPEAQLPSSLEPAMTPQQRALVWQAASKWSYAQALFAKGVEPRYYEPIRAEAVDAAAQLDVELPPLPMDAADDDREAAVIALLREQGAQSVSAGMQQQLGQEAAALAELAVHSHLLLLTYSPKIDEAPQWAATIRTAAEASGLTTDLWEPLVAQVEQQEEFATVKSTVFDLHRRVAQHLQGAAEEAPPAP